MKKTIGIVLILTLILALLSGCGTSAKDSTIKVGASITPHAEILNVAKGILEKKGITLEVIEFSEIGRAHV